VPTCMRDHISISVDVLYVTCTPKLSSRAPSERMRGQVEGPCVVAIITIPL
jgi:hypothetical protein